MRDSGSFSTDIQVATDDIWTPYISDIIPDKAAYVQVSLDVVWTTDPGYRYDANGDGCPPETTEDRDIVAAMWQDEDGNDLGPVDLSKKALRVAIERAVDEIELPPDLYVSDADERDEYNPDDAYEPDCDEVGYNPYTGARDDDC